MSEFISPYEISEMFHKKFDGFDFAEPYLNGVFEDDPKKGRITIGVRTPWYDFEYFVYSKESFWGCIANVESVEDVIQHAVGHLNTAVAKQLGPDGRNAIRLQGRYPYGEVEESDPKDAVTKLYADGIEYPLVKVANNDKQGVVTVYVNHDNAWDDQTLVEAPVVTFLCKCTKCKKHYDHILELRREKNE